MARRRAQAMGFGTLALLGVAGWFLFGRKAAAASVAPSAPSGSSMPPPAPGESSEAYADRLKVWGLTTGQMYPTMEGYSDNPEWYSWQAMGPKGTLHGW